MTRRVMKSAAGGSKKLAIVRRLFVQIGLQVWSGQYQHLSAQYSVVVGPIESDLHIWRFARKRGKLLLTILVKGTCVRVWTRTGPTVQQRHASLGREVKLTRNCGKVPKHVRGPSAP